MTLFVFRMLVMFAGDIWKWHYYDQLEVFKKAPSENWVGAEREKSRKRDDGNFRRVPLSSNS